MSNYVEDSGIEHLLGTGIWKRPTGHDVDRIIRPANPSSEFGAALKIGTEQRHPDETVLIVVKARQRLNRQVEEVDRVAGFSQAGGEE